MSIRAAFPAPGLAALLALVLATVPATLEAQSDILLRLRSGSPAGDRARVDSAGGFAFTGQLGIGIIPASGSGTRAMWYPFKAAFRVGGVDGTQWNDASVGFYSVAGGYNTRATAYGSVAFGDNNEASGTGAAAVGSGNLASGTVSFATGASNRCTGFACVSMGFTNNASGQGSIAIGYRATANADYSVAIGHRASTNGRTGAVVFSDASTTDSIRASANNQFNVRAAGGYRLFTNATTTTGVTLNAGGSSWNVVSDRAAKEDFLAVDGEDILNRVRGIPVTTWRYRAEEDRSVLHIGPMAQDWDAAFGFGGDGTTINLSDFDGVNLAAIQALERRTAELRGELAERDSRIAELEARLARLEALVADRDR